MVEELHGYRIADPYRWLEDPDAEEVKQWVDAQNALTKEVLEQCPTRQQLKQVFV